MSNYRRGGSAGSGGPQRFCFFRADLRPVGVPAYRRAQAANPGGSCQPEQKAARLGGAMTRVMTAERRGLTWSKGSAKRGGRVVILYSEVPTPTSPTNVSLDTISSGKYPRPPDGFASRNGERPRRAGCGKTARPVRSGEFQDPSCSPSSQRRDGANEA